MHQAGDDAARQIPQGPLAFPGYHGVYGKRHKSILEPGAPLPSERLTALKLLYHNDYKTSVSIEPMLEGLYGTIDVVNAVKPYVTEKIWIGKMNKPRLRVDMSIKENHQALYGVEWYQRNEEIVALYRWFKDDPQIAWKDSIKKVIAAHENSG